MNESAARDVVLLRAVETTDRERTLWTDADRAWASRAAAEVVGSDAPRDGFIARRAALGVERLEGRHPSVRRLRQALAWRPWIGIALVVAAFALGVAADQVGAAQRLNVLAFPLLALLAWNLAVYVAIFASTFGRTVRHSAGLGPIRDLVARLAHHRARTATDRGGRGPLAAAATRYADDWVELSAPLLRARVARVLHFAAAAFALGALAGLYLRGMVFEYRAGWESTFLDASTVHRLLAFVLAPGAAVTGIAIPDAEHIRAIGMGKSGDAAHWIHLYAATVAVLVLVPRAFLAAAAWFAQRRAANFRLPLDDAYSRRLLREFGRGGATRVRVVPYSYSIPAPAESGLRAVLARVFGEKVDVSIAAPVAYGTEDDLPADLAVGSTADIVVALLNFAATPEGENHGAFLAALAARVAPSATLVAIVDEERFRQRFATQPLRIVERRALWGELFASRKLAPIFVDLEHPDLLAAETALNDALDGPIP